MKLKGKVAIVTGGGKGLGRGIALTFAREGANVAIAGRSEDALLKTAAEIERLGRKALAIPTDVSKEEQVNNFVNKVKDKFGKIDFLVNNAGILLSKKVTETTLEDWEEVINTNLRGTFLMTRAVLEIMRKQRSGHIFNISSVGGRIGLAEKSAYCASKFGIVGFSKAVAKEVKQDNIKVQVVYPYMVDSYNEIDWSKQGKEQLRAVKVEDVADMIVYYASLPLRVLVEDIIFDPYIR